MKLYIVLQNLVVFRSNWKNLLREDCYFLLITSQNAYKYIGNNLNFFNKIIVLENYIFESVSLEVNRVLKNNIWEDIKVLCNDEYCLPLAAELRHKFNISGDRKDIIDKFTNKIIMKDTLCDKIFCPKYIKYDVNEARKNLDEYIREIAFELSFPIIAKPTNLAACDGVVRIDNEEGFKNWLNDNLYSYDYELDEYINGVLYHIDSIVFDNKIIKPFIGRYSSPVANFMSGQPVGTILLDERNKLYSKLEEFNYNVLKAIGDVPNCMTHLEVFVDNNENIVFLEIAARAAGGLIPQMYQKAYGINIEEIHFQLQMGNKFTKEIELKENVAWLWYPYKEGMYVDKNAIIEISCKADFYWDIGEKEIQRKCISIRDRIGGVMISNTDYDILEKDFLWLINDYFPYKNKL